MFRVKICGITNLADAEAALNAGADAIGLNFYAPSPRRVSIEQAKQIVGSLPTNVLPVGVFVSQTPAEVEEIAQVVGLRAVQTYSGDALEYAFALHSHIPAFRVKSTEDLVNISTLVKLGSHSALLVDSFVQGEMGGTGHVAPWDLLKHFQPGVPLILAGGLNAGNVAEAIRTVRPFGVDVASGVEYALGLKDHAEMRAFVKAARDALNSLD